MAQLPLPSMTTVGSCQLSLLRSLSLCLSFYHKPSAPHSSLDHIIVSNNQKPVPQIRTPLLDLSLLVPESPQPPSAQSPELKACLGPFPLPPSPAVWGRASGLVDIFTVMYTLSNLSLPTGKSYGQLEKHLLECSPHPFPTQLLYVAIVFECGCCVPLSGYQGSFFGQG